MTKSICLDGLWRFTPDLECRPENNHNLTEGFIYADSAISRIDWEWGNVPGVWNKYAEVYRLYEGVFWFCKEVSVTGIKEDTKTRLRFGGVGYRADVFVNGQPVGIHEGTYTEFVIDTTGLIHNGSNLITVRVDNRAIIRKWPCDRGYFGYGGIHRSVYLEILDSGCFEELELTPVYDVEAACGTLKVKGKVYGSDVGSIQIVLEDQSEKIEVDITGSFDKVVSFGDITPWTPENPTLYRVTVSSDQDRKEYSIGFKSFISKNGKLILNGKPYILKGVCYVYDSPNYGLVMTHDQLEKDLSEMKAAGVNAIRLHYPMNDLFYEMADEIGFLCWIEPNIYCYKPANSLKNTHFSDPVYIENAEQMIKEMISPARSHASVAFYGIGNECNLDHPEAEPFFKRMAALVRTTDNTRLLAFAALYGLVGKIGEIIDVIGLNSYYGWYDRISDLYEFEPLAKMDGTVDLTPFHEMVKEVLERVPEDMPIMLTEFGADSIPGQHSSCADLWSEEYHADLIKETIEASYMYDRISGTYVFCFVDNLDPSKSRNGYWNYLNLKGVLSYQRDRKLSWYAMRDMYTDNRRNMNEV